MLLLSPLQGVHLIVRKCLNENRDPDTRILFCGIISTFRIPATGAMVIFSFRSIKNLTKFHTNYDEKLKIK